MMDMNILNYGDFTAALLEAGFSMGGGNDEGIFAVVPWSWDGQPLYETLVRWHTGDPETDPWEWRIRVLDERNDIAYAKLFFKKSGFITRDWYPYFLAVRRGAETLEDAWQDGRISRPAKLIYDIVQDHGALPLHAIKGLAGFGREDKSQFDQALVELQMGMYLTLCGRQQKISQKGEAYGWSSTVLCTTELFWGQDVFDTASRIDRQEAIRAITQRVCLLNQGASPKKIKKFIAG